MRILTYFFYIVIASALGVSSSSASLLTKQMLPQVGTEAYIKEHGDAFDWQNFKHYEELAVSLSELAEREFSVIIARIINQIKGSEAFFKKRHAWLLDKLREAAYGWVNDTVISRARFMGVESSEEVFPEMSESCDTDEDGWRISFMRGYDADPVDIDMSEDDMSGDTDSSDLCCEQADSYDIDCDEGSYNEHDFERLEMDFEAWQCSELYRVLSITVSSIDEFTQEDIDEYALKIFLKQHVVGSYVGDYSWLVNEIVEGSLETSDDYVRDIYGKIGVKRELLSAILEGLWFDFDWEAYDITDPFFIGHTYIQTLQSLQQGRSAKDIKEHILDSIRELVTFESAEFNELHIREKYNEYVRHNDWLGALIEWSLYTAYRKVFASTEFASPLTLDHAHSASLFMDHKAYFIEQVQKARMRAAEYYVKVYPHHTTNTLVYTDGQGKRAELNLLKKLSNVRRKGKAYEPLRATGSENVFVPALYFVVQSSEEDSLPHFIKVPLDPSRFNVPLRPLTKADDDIVCRGVTDTNYFKQAEKDVIAGKMLQGLNREQASLKISALVKGDSGEITRNQSLIHSERVWMELLRKRSHIELIVQILEEEITKKFGAGSYMVHSVVMLAYSTNSVCQLCSPTLVALLNSHKKGEFLQQLAEVLSCYKKGTIFSVPGYSHKTKQADWTKFRLNLCVTAYKDFDYEANDLTDTDQRVSSRKTCHANPKAKLFMPNNEIDISAQVKLSDGKLDKNQRFFYEFVGKDIHSTPSKKGQAAKPNKEISCSSGSKYWKKVRQKK